MTRQYWLYVAVVVATALVILPVSPAADDPGLIQLALAGEAMPGDWSPFFASVIRMAALVAPHDLYLVLFAFCLGLLALAIPLVANALSPSITVSAAVSTVLILSPVSVLLMQSTSLPSSIAIYPGLACFLFGVWGLLGAARRQAVGGLWVAPFIAASLFRPEFFLSVLLFVPTLVWLSWGKPRAALIVRSVSLAVGLAVLGYGWRGVPVPTAARTEIAFQQHVSLRRCLAGRCGTNDSFRDYEEVARSVFPPDAGPAEALSANPLAFAAHVGANALQAAAGLLSLGFFAPLFLDDPWWLRLLGLLVGLPVVTWTVRQLWASRPRRAQPIVWFMLASSIPFVVEQCLLYPRSHYAAMPVVVLALTLIASHPAPESSRQTRP